MSASAKPTTFKLVRGGKDGVQFQIAQFSSPTNLKTLPAPLTLARQVQVIDSKPKPRFGNATVFEPTKQDPSQYPMILRDGEGNTRTGLYEDIPGIYMVFVKEGNTLKVYPAGKWFKFGTAKPPPAPVDPYAEPPTVPVLNSVSKVTDQATKLFSTITTQVKEDPETKTRRSRLIKGSIEEAEDGEGMDWDDGELYVNDETILTYEEADELDQKDDEAKALTKSAKKLKEMAKETTGEYEVDQEKAWLFDLFETSEGEDEDEAEEDATDADEEEEASKDTGSKKRKAPGDLSDGPPAKRVKKEEKEKQIKSEQDMHILRQTFRNGFWTTPTLSSKQIVALCTNIPNFELSKKGVPETPNQAYWKTLLRQCIQNHTTKVGTDSYVWKE